LPREQLEKTNKYLACVLDASQGPVKVPTYEGFKETIGKMTLINKTLSDSDNYFFEFFPHTTQTPMGIVWQRGTDGTNYPVAILELDQNLGQNYQWMTHVCSYLEVYAGGVPIGTTVNKGVITAIGTYATLDVRTQSSETLTAYRSNSGAVVSKVRVQDGVSIVSPVPEAHEFQPIWDGNNTDKILSTEKYKRVLSYNHDDEEVASGAFVTVSPPDYYFFNTTLDNSLPYVFRGFSNLSIDFMGISSTTPSGAGNVWLDVVIGRRSDLDTITDEIFTIGISNGEATWPGPLTTKRKYKSTVVVRKEDQKTLKGKKEKKEKTVQDKEEASDSEEELKEERKKKAAPRSLSEPRGKEAMATPSYAWSGSGRLTFYTVVPVEYIKVKMNSSFASNLFPDLAYNCHIELENGFNVDQLNSSPVFYLAIDKVDTSQDIEVRGFVNVELLPKAELIKDLKPGRDKDILLSDYNAARKLFMHSDEIGLRTVYNKCDYDYLKRTGVFANLSLRLNHYGYASGFSSWAARVARAMRPIATRIGDYSRKALEYAPHVLGTVARVGSVATALGEGNPLPLVNSISSVFGPGPSGYLSTTMKGVGYSSVRPGKGTDVRALMKSDTKRVEEVEESYITELKGLGKEDYKKLEDPREIPAYIKSLKEGTCEACQHEQGYHTIEALTFAEFHGIDPQLLRWPATTFKEMEAKCESPIMPCQRARLMKALVEKKKWKHLIRNMVVAISLHVAMHGEKNVSSLPRSVKTFIERCRKKEDAFIDEYGYASTTGKIVGTHLEEDPTFSVLESKLPEKKDYDNPAVLFGKGACLPFPYVTISGKAGLAYVMVSHLPLQHHYYMSKVAGQATPSVRARPQHPQRYVRQQVGNLMLNFDPYLADMATFMDYLSTCGYFPSEAEIFLTCSKAPVKAILDTSWTMAAHCALANFISSPFYSNAFAYSGSVRNTDSGTVFDAVADTAAKISACEEAGISLIHSEWGNIGLEEIKAKGPQHICIHSLEALWWFMHFRQKVGVQPFVVEYSKQLILPSDGLVKAMTKLGLPETYITEAKEKESTHAKYSAMVQSGIKYMNELKSAQSTETPMSDVKTLMDSYTGLDFDKENLQKQYDEIIAKRNNPFAFIKNARETAVKMKEVRLKALENKAKQDTKKRSTDWPVIVMKNDKPYKTVTQQEFEAMAANVFAIGVNKYTKKPFVYAKDAENLKSWGNSFFEIFTNEKGAYQLRWKPDITFGAMRSFVIEYLVPKQVTAPKPPPRPAKLKVQKQAIPAAPASVPPARGGAPGKRGEQEHKRLPRGAPPPRGIPGPAPAPSAFDGAPRKPAKRQEEEEEQESESGEEGQDGGDQDDYAFP